MKVYGYLFVAFVASTPPSNGFTASGQVSKNETRADASDRAKRGHTAHGEAPKNGARRAASGEIGGQSIGGSKSASGINGTGTGPSRSPSINGTRMGAQH